MTPEWDDCRAKPVLTLSKNLKSENGGTVVVSFESDPFRIAALDEYRDLWNVWAANERVSLSASEVFEKLYALHGKMQRDSERYELVVSDGILCWGRLGVGVRHPLLNRPVRLIFDPQIPEFRIVDIFEPTEFYSALFRSMPDIDGGVIGKIKSEFDLLDLHPLGTNDVTGFLKSLVSTLSPKGQYIETGAPGPERPEPVIGRDPVFILRKRTMGVARAIDAIIENIAEGGVISRSLLNVVGVETTNSEAENPQSFAREQTGANVGMLSDEDILFTKEANPEQLEIARCLERDDCVLVQGPPGTGKTHTIANLLGHLLAQGKSVLVLSHTTKALKVLREKVVKGLQPLCVSVLDSKDDDAALKSSIEGIVERIGNADTARLEREITRLTSERERLVDQTHRLQGDVLNARLDEQREIIIDGSGVRPMASAKEVALGIGVSNWIPQPVELGHPLPLTSSEIAELYLTNESVSKADETKLTCALPEPSEVANPFDFQALCSERRDLGSFDLGFRSSLWNSPDSAKAEDLEEPFSLANEVAASYERFPVWLTRVVDAGQSDSERASWDALLTEISAVRRDAVAAQPLLLIHTPAISESLDKDRAADVYSAIAHEVTLTGKAPGFLTLLARSEWKSAINDATVGAGVKPRLPEHFDALASLARLENRREALKRRWTAQVTAIGGPEANSLGLEPEVTALRQSTSMTTALDWIAKAWHLSSARLSSIGLDWSVLQSEADSEYLESDLAGRVVGVIRAKLPAIFAAEKARRRWSTIEKESNRLRQVAASWPANEATVPLRQALEFFDDIAFEREFAEMTRLRNVSERVKIRASLLASLDKSAPGWANAIRARAGQHGEAVAPGDVILAWRWRQLNDELDRRDTVSMPELMRELEDSRSRLRETTIDLVDRKSWHSQLARTTLRQQQALYGFAEAKRRLGRGTGKRAAKLAAEARSNMSDARAAVPVWIMPVVKAAEIFNPRSPRFDVVIIDEASQSDVTGLIAFYFGKQIVVVGDDEQVSPSAVGEKADEAQHLIDEMLQGIPGAQLFDGKQSLYDIAKRSFSATICLLEHFRCVPEIIQFSNELSYFGKIRPLRERTPADPQPAVVEHRVASTGSEGKRNEEEAIAVASLVMAAIEQPEYDNKTFGVISMVGDEQAYRIEEIIRAMLPVAVVEARRLLSGSAAQFQGDERNVMFLSLVDTGQGLPLPLRDTRPFQQRYNVAASRAQDQMWVVHSLDRSIELKPNDLRRKLIEHAIDPGFAERNKKEALKRAESPFEEAVIRLLTGAGFKVQTQHSVGAYRIDIVVEGRNQKRLAVECDGDRYHTLENLKEDADRQAILERVGWTFVRIRGSRFYRNPDIAMAPVFERLAQLGIQPGYKINVTETTGEELLLRVRSRATELQQSITENFAAPKAKIRRSWRSKSPESMPLVLEQGVTNEIGAIGPLFDSEPPLVKGDFYEIVSKQNICLLDVDSEGDPDKVNVVSDSSSVEEIISIATVRLDAKPTPQSLKLTDASGTEMIAVSESYGSSLIGLLTSMGLEFVDLREKHGALWVIGGPELSQKLHALKPDEVKFIFAEGGGRKTGYRPAWWTQNSG